MAQKFRKLLEKSFFTLVLFLLSGSLIVLPSLLVIKPEVKGLLRSLWNVSALMIEPRLRTGWGMLPSLALDVAFWCIVLILVLRREFAIKILKVVWWTGVAPLLLLAVMSLLWSVDFWATLTGLYVALKITLLGLYLSQHYSMDENLELLVGVLTLASLFSFFALWQVPAQSIHLGGEWKGIFTWKNDLGRLMALGNALLIVYWFRNPVLWKRIFVAVLFVASGILLVFSRSSTGILALVGLYGILVLYCVWLRWGMRLRTRTYWLVAAVVVALAVLVIVNIGLLLDLFDKSTTLNGRTPLWEILWRRFEERPILGFGYEAFWKQYPQGIVPPGWVEGFATHAHNGYIDVVLALGLIGLILYIFALGLSWRNALKLARQKRQIIFIWPLLILAYLSFANLTYSVAFSFPGFHWGLLALAAGAVLRALESTQGVDEAISL